MLFSASKKKIFRGIILKLSYIFAILPGIGEFQPSLEINFFHKTYQILDYNQILIPINQDSVPETHYYPQIFHSIYPFFFKKEDTKLRNLLIKHQNLLYRNKNKLSQASLDDLYATLQEENDVAKAKYWQLSESLICSGQFINNDSISQIFKQIFYQKDSVYKQFSLFITSYHDYLFRQSGKDFLYYFAATKYFNPPQSIEQKISTLYHQYSEIIDSQITYKERMDLLLKINFQLKPILSEYLSIIKQNYQNQSLISKTNFLLHGQSFTEKAFKRIDLEIAKNSYSSAIKLALLIRNYHQLILLQTILVLLIILFLLGFVLLYRLVKFKYITFSICILAFLTLMIFSFSSQNKIHHISKKIKNIEKLTLFQINQQLNQKNSSLNEYCSLDFLKSSMMNETKKLNILILGKGGKSHINSRTHKPLGSNLTDALIILSINFEDRKVNQISLPRDLIYNHVKINSLYKFYGIEKTKSAVFDITGIKIDKYAIVDFNFVRKFIDLIDGVSIALDKDLKDFEWFFLRAGEHNLYGNNCLKYMRSRRTTSDFSRSARQQQVITQLFQKLSDPATKKNLLTKKFFALYSLFQEINTDFKLDEIIILAEKFSTDYSFNSIVLSTYNCFNSEYNIDMGYIIYPKRNSWLSVKSYLKNKNFF